MRRLKQKVAQSTQLIKTNLDNELEQIYGLSSI